MSTKSRRQPGATDGHIETARLAPTVDFAFSREAVDLRDGIGGMLDQEMDAASVTGDDPMFGALRVLRAAVVKDLNGRAPELARLIEVAVDATEPALVTAFRLYGDASRATRSRRATGCATPASCRAVLVLKC